MRLVLAYREKRESFSVVVSPFWDQSQERLQVAQAVSCWRSTGAEGQRRVGLVIAQKRIALIWREAVV